APTAADNCPGLTTNCVPAPGSIFPQGVTTVTCIATDASGNTNACTFTVTVNVAAPVITTQPANQFIPMRNGAAISVVATGTATLINQQPFGPVVPFEVSTGGVGVAVGAGGLDIMFNQGNDITELLVPVTWDFSLPGQTLYASVMMKMKVPVANQRALEMG